MNHDKQEQARHLYFAQSKTQKEIAHLLDVNEKTIYNWIKRHSWDKLRQAAHQAPALISEGLASQLVELQNSIARREPGCRFATMEESQIMLRLVTMMEKMKKFPSLSVNTQVLETFRNWMRPRDKSFTRDLSLYAGLFLQGYTQNGYRPYELEFGIDGVSPIDTFYEEEPTKEKEKPTENVAGHTSHQQPENPSVEPIQSVDNHNTSTTQAIFPPPVKTGNQPGAQPAESRDKPGSEHRNPDPQKIGESQIDGSPLGGGGSPVKTGKKPANNNRENDFPWRKRLHDLAQKKKPSSTHHNLRPKSRKE